MVRALLSAEEKKKYFFKFNVDGLLRGDYQSRMTGYATARQNGWMSANDKMCIRDRFESSQALDYKTGAPSSVQNREMEEGGGIVEL